MAKKPEASALVEVLFLGPTHRLEAYGKTVERGKTALFSRAEVFALRAVDRIHIEVLDAPTGGDTPDGAPSEPAAETGEGQAKTNQEEA